MIVKDGQIYVDTRELVEDIQDNYTDLDIHIMDLLSKIIEGDNDDSRSD